MVDQLSLLHSHFSCILFFVTRSKTQETIPELCDNGGWVRDSGQLNLGDIGWQWVVGLIKLSYKLQKLQYHFKKSCKRDITTVCIVIVSFREKKNLLWLIIWADFSWCRISRFIIIVSLARLSLSSVHWVTPVLFSTDDQPCSTTTRKTLCYSHFASWLNFMLAIVYVSCIIMCWAKGTLLDKYCSVVMIGIYIKCLI